MASMSRAEMVKVIGRGESVMVQSPGRPPRIVSRVEDLPSQADLAVESGDPVTREDAKSAARRKAQEAAKELAAIEKAEADDKAKAEPEPEPEQERLNVPPKPPAHRRG